MIQFISLRDTTVKEFAFQGITPNASASEAKSPDLNPIEKYWSWMRRQLRARDMADLKAGRAVQGKTAYKQRLRNILRFSRSQVVAGNLAKGFYRVCLEVEKKNVATSRG